MNKFLVLLLIPLFISKEQTSKIIARQGHISFFSYTSVENIQAENNQVLSIVDLSTGDIAVSILMNAFIFEKELMREHFNESYIESDIYPKATFEGSIIDFDPKIENTQTRMVKGIFSMHGATKALDIKVKIENNDSKYIISGAFDAQVNDYKIKIPPLLSGNIAKTIKVEFKFEYESYGI